jgi:hypothetical protein
MSVAIAMAKYRTCGISVDAVSRANCARRPFLLRHRRSVDRERGRVVAALRSLATAERSPRVTFHRRGKIGNCWGES